MKDFKNKLVYITGGSSGIGFAAAKAFLVKGAKVLLIARNHEKLNSAREKLIEEHSFSKGDVDVLSGDISDYEGIRNALEIKMKSTGVPDILVNCAGMAYPDYFDRIPHEIFVKTININLVGTWNVISTVVPHMKEKGGYLVNVSSMSGFIGTFGYAAYSASKFGIVGFSEVLKSELKPYGVGVSVLCPPDTDTPQLKEEDLTKPDETRAISGNVKLMQPDAVAHHLLRGIEKGSFMILPGFMNKVTYILKKLFPWLVFAIMDGDIRKVQRNRSKN